MAGSVPFKKIESKFARKIRTTSLLCSEIGRKKVPPGAFPSSIKADTSTPLEAIFFSEISAASGIAGKTIP